MRGRVISVAMRRRLASAFLALGLKSNWAAVAISGRAINAGHKARRDVMRLCEREILLAELAEAQRMHRPTRAIRKAISSEMAGLLS